MKRIFKALFIIVIAFIVSCDYSERDIIDPRLPRYTESGANTAGCIINEKVWFDPCYFGFFDSRTSCDGLIVGTDTSLNYSQLRFSGGYYTPGFEDLESLDIVFRLYGTKISNLGNLRSLIGNQLVVDGTSVYADLIKNGSSVMDCDGSEVIQDGKIFFRSDGPNHMAFAGTFGFSSTNDCGKNEVFYGRFDYDVAKIRFEFLN